MASHTFTYYTLEYGVFDGDTFNDVTLDLGLGLRYSGLRLRLMGINAPELYDLVTGTDGKKHEQPNPAGVASRDYLAQLVYGYPQLQVVSYHWDKYSGRIDADVFLPGDDQSLSTKMLSAGQAVAYKP